MGVGTETTDTANWTAGTSLEGGKVEWEGERERGERERERERKRELDLHICIIL